uniref:Phospholipase-like protein n=1 Tax=Tanacetum cinerariifolium TaxID=118510 RepID=A0A699JZA1_TANCI|nr:phospholipase-like protein [Tanacetum cinerariifolium]
MRLVENLEVWNDFRWGEYIWRHLYDLIMNVVNKKKWEHLQGLSKSRNYVPTYTLSRFVWFFKDSPVNLDLTPTISKQQTVWYMAFCKFFLSYIPRTPPTTYTYLFDDYIKKLSASRKRGKIDTRDLLIIRRCDTTIVEKIRLKDRVIAKLNSRVFKLEEETLKKELHSIKLQLASTINHNKSMVEEVTFLKKDFKQKENKYLEDFLGMKSMKKKVEDRLIKQDKSLQTVHMLCRPKPYYNELNKVAIGYKNPLCLTRAKQAQPALYNGHEIIKDNHASAIVHNTEDTLEMAEITTKKMNAKMNDPECVTRQVKIAPHDYSKENFLATFTPQKQLTHEQIFWSNDLIKLKSKALKERTKVSRPIKALIVYPPNTPATLVPKVLPTKSKVKIHILTLIQLFQNLTKHVKRGLHQLGSMRGKGVLNKSRNVTSKRSFHSLKHSKTILRAFKRL